MSAEDWAVRVRHDRGMTSKGETVLSVPPVCAQCRARLLGTWKCCPYCGVIRSQYHEIDRPSLRGAAL